MEQFVKDAFCGLCHVPLTCQFPTSRIGKHRVLLICVSIYIQNKEDRRLTINTMKILKLWLLTLLVFVTMLPISHCNKLTRPNFLVKAVNLGGWLVTEGWIKPSLFDAIPNKDFLVST